MKARLLSLALLAATLPAGPASASAPPVVPADLAKTTRQVDRAVALLETGRIADAVRAAALLAGVTPEAPAPAAAPAPAHVATPIAALLRAVETATPAVRAAVAGAPHITEGEMSRLLTRSTTVPPLEGAVHELEALRRAGSLAVDEEALYGAALSVASAIDASLPALATVRAPATTAVAGCDVLSQLPAICIGGEGPNELTANAALVIDLGGDDVHRHAAGAAGVLDNGMAVSVTIDLGGDDRYERTTGIAHGAGNLGVGMLVDAAGDDVYSIVASTATQTATGQGTNLSAGAGLLADLGGSDSYSVTNTRVDSALAAGQGRGTQPGFGILLDHGTGADSYLVSARSAGLIETPDEIKVGGINANGMGLGGLGGVGIHSDGGGSDTLTMETISPVVPPEETRPITQVPLGGPSGFGGGSTGGVGLMLSGNGPTTRRATGFMQAPWSGIETVAAFGWSVSGAGLLRDEGGDDTYVAEATSHAHHRVVLGPDCACPEGHAEARQSIPNVASVSVRTMGVAAEGVAILEDRGGDDTYLAVATALAEAEVVDHRPEESEGISDAVAQANAVSLDAHGVGSGGSAALLDRAGDDDYDARADSRAEATAEGNGSQAAAISGRVFTDAQGAATSSGPTPGRAVLDDAGGSDTYRASSESTAATTPPGGATAADVISSAQGSVAGNSAAVLHDRDAAASDTFTLTPPDPACSGTRGQGTWQDCGSAAGIGIVDDEGRHLRR